jgi:hypothetical protein
LLNSRRFAENGRRNRCDAEANPQELKYRKDQRRKVS